MKRIRRTLGNGALATAIAATLFNGCATKNDAVARAEKMESDRPGLAETKTIAEEGFIYGLPIVMNYAVMYEYCRGPRTPASSKHRSTRSRTKARVFTYRDTTVVTPNSDTPYSMLWLDLRAEPIVLLGPGSGKRRAITRCMLCDGNTFNYGYIGSRATGN